MRLPWAAVAALLAISAAACVGNGLDPGSSVTRCLDGLCPAPAEGPQQPSGDGWRLIADEDEVGGPYRTGIAADADSLARLWADVGLSTPVPSVDFRSEVVVWFGAVHGSSCPRLRLDNVRYNPGRGVLHPVLTRFELGACTADAIGHAYVVAIQRSMLPDGPFAIQLQATPAPRGVIETEVTIVDANLSVPGSTLADGQVAHPTPFADGGPQRVELGDYLEPDEPALFRMSVACGVRWLDTFNDTRWRSGEEAVPAEWAGAVQPDRTIDLLITLHVDPETRIEATAADHTIVYLPSGKVPPSCP